MMGSLDRRYKKTGRFDQDEPDDDVDYPELVAGPADWDDDIDFEPERVTCPECGGEGAFLGNLGRLEHFRCINCGIDFNRPRETSKTADIDNGDWWAERARLADDTKPDYGIDDEDSYVFDQEDLDHLNFEVGFDVVVELDSEFWPYNYLIKADMYGRGDSKFMAQLNLKTRTRRASKTADYTSQDGMMDGGWGSTVPQDTWAWEKNPNEYNICKQCGSEYKVEPHGYGGWDTLCRLCGRTLAARQSGMIEITGDFADWVQDHAPSSATAGEALSAALEAENPGYEVLEAYMCEDYSHIIAYLQLKDEKEAHQGGHKDGQ